MKNFFSRVIGSIRAFFSGIFRYSWRHKIQAGIALVLIAGIGYWSYTAISAGNAPAQYVLAIAHTASIESTITGSGQVASSHQLSLSPKASGTVTSVLVRPGASVAAGQLIATIDSTDAQKAVRDASASLEGARISYAQSIANTSQSTQSTEDAALNTTAGAYSDLDTIMPGMDSLLNGPDVAKNYTRKNLDAYATLAGPSVEIMNYRNATASSYEAAVTAYQSAHATYLSLDRNSDPAAITDAVSQAYTASVAVAQAVKATNDYLTAVRTKLTDTSQTVPTILTTHLASLKSYASTINADTASLLTAHNNLISSQATLAGSGATLDEQSAQLALTKAQNAYQDALDTLANYSVRAPFSGTIAAVALQKYDQASAGNPIATLVTNDEYATLSLNETDAASVRIGQNVTLTFDAINGLSIPGTVAEVDTVGTVSQGVVSYTVKIAFATQDVRILPGMTVNASVVTASKDMALVVPNAAVKTQNGQSYVEVVTGGPARSGTATSTAGRARFASTTAAQMSATNTASGFNRASTTGGLNRASSAALTVDATSVTMTRIPVTIGIVNDTMTEIVSGLTPGSRVVTQTIAKNGSSSTAPRSILNIFGGNAARATGTGATRATGASTGAARTGGGTAAVTRPGG